MSIMKEIAIALDCLENHHINCEWMAEPDLEAEESESCAEFAMQFGKGYDYLSCHEHNKMREWSKMLRENMNSYNAKELPREKN